MSSSPIEPVNDQPFPSSLALSVSPLPPTPTEGPRSSTPSRTLSPVQVSSQPVTSTSTTHERLYGTKGNSFHFDFSSPPLEDQDQTEIQLHSSPLRNGPKPTSQYSASANDQCENLHPYSSSQTSADADANENENINETFEVLEILDSPVKSRTTNNWDAAHQFQDILDSSRHLSLPPVSPGFISSDSDIHEITEIPPVSHDSQARLAPLPRRFVQDINATEDIHELQSNFNFTPRSTKRGGPSSPLFVPTEPNTPVVELPSEIHSSSAIYNSALQQRSTTVNIVSSPTRRSTTLQSHGRHITVSAETTHITASSNARTTAKTPPPASSRFQPLPSSSPIFESKSPFSPELKITSESQRIRRQRSLSDSSDILLASGPAVTYNNDVQPPQRKVLKTTNKYVSAEFSLEKELEGIFNQDRAFGTGSRTTSRKVSRTVATKSTSTSGITKRAERELEAQRKREARLAQKAAEKAKADELKALNEANRRRSGQVQRTEAMSDMFVMLEHAQEFLETKLGRKMYVGLTEHSVNIEALLGGELEIDEKLAESLEMAVADAQESSNTTGGVKKRTRPKGKSNMPVTSIAMKRRVKVRYDPEQSMFLPVENAYMEPLGSQIRLLDMVELSSREKLDSAESQASFLKTVMQQHNNNRPTEPGPGEEQKQIICIVQGFTQVMRKSANERNKKVATRVLELMGHQVPASAQASKPVGARRKKKTTNDAGADFADSPGGVDGAMLERAFLELQLKHDYKLVYTNDDNDTVEWVLALLKDLSVKWYTNKTYNGFYTNWVMSAPSLASNGGGSGSGIESASAATAAASFEISTDPTEGDVSHIRSATNPREITSKALQLIKMVSANVATSVVDKYGNIAKLAQEFEVNGKRNIQDIRVVIGDGGGRGESQNSQQNEGRMISRAPVKTIELILSCRDPDQVLN